MSMTSKLRNRFQIARGRANVRIGRMTGDRSRQVRGHRQRLGGVTRQFGERLKGTGQDLRHSFRRGSGTGRSRTPM
jgi:uncharacterized protein YjbJ (UPF0337 family)